MWNVSWFRLGGVALGLALQLGCASMSRRIAEEVSPSLVGGAVEGGADALATSEVQRDLASLLEDRQLRAAVGGMTSVLVAGMIDPITAPERAARVRSFTAAMVGALGQASARVLQRDLSPAMAQAAGAAIDAVLTAALTPGHQEQTEALVNRLMRGAAAGMAGGLRDDLYPALGATFGAPGFAESMGDVGFAFSRGVVRGSDAAMQEIAERRKVTNEPENLVTWLTSTTLLGISTSLLMAAALGVGLVLVSVLLVRASRERQRLALSASRRETALIALVADLSGRVGVDVRTRLAELEAEDAVGPR